MSDEPSYYSPTRIDHILREWPRYQSDAEGCRTSVPDAHRHGKGQRHDALRAADIVADIERAIAICLRQWSLEWNAVDHVQRGYSLSQVAATLRLRKDDVLHAYDAATTRMAGYLGWVEEPTDAD